LSAAEVLSAAGFALPAFLDLDCRPSTLILYA